MRLGIGSYTYGWAVGVEGNRPAGAMGALDIIARAGELGVGVVQLCDNLPAAAYEGSSVDEIAAVSRELGIQIELGTRGIGEEHLCRFVSLARRLGSEVLRVVVDCPGDEPTPLQVVEQLRRVVPALVESQVVLGIENHDRFGCATLVSIVRELDSQQIGICLDTANSFGALEGPALVVETLGPYTVNLHLKDFAVRRMPHLMGFTVEGRPAGQGMLNIPWVLERLRAFGRDVSAIIELWTPPEASIEQTIAKEAEWARRSVRAVRQWIAE